MVALRWREDRDAIEALKIQRERVDGELVFPGSDGEVLRGDTANDALPTWLTASAT